MLNPASSDRIRHDQFGASEVSVKCACQKDGALTVLPLPHFMQIGQDEALRIADSLCPRCSRQRR